MRIATLTSKGQTTIPAEVRHALHLKTGDKVVFDIQNNHAILSKAGPFDYLYHGALSQSLTDEWNSPEDEEAYRDL